MHTLNIFLECPSVSVPAAVNVPQSDTKTQASDMTFICSPQVPQTGLSGYYIWNTVIYEEKVCFHGKLLLLLLHGKILIPTMFEIKTNRLLVKYIN